MIDPRAMPVFPLAPASLSLAETTAPESVAAEAVERSPAAVQAELPTFPPEPPGRMPPPGPPRGPDNDPDDQEAPETPTDEPPPVPVRDPPSEPTQPPLVV